MFGINFIGHRDLRRILASRRLGGLASQKRLSRTRNIPWDCGPESERRMGVVHGQEMVLNIGPQHPATHGVLRLQVKTDGEVISEITPYLGYLHRCFEKHSENVTYEQVIPFTDRWDYLASMTMNFGYVVAMEQLMEIKVNDRVEYIRVIMAELQRIASHLLAIGVFGLDLGAFTLSSTCSETEKEFWIFSK